MDLGIKGKTALVLASTKGLGFGCASALAKEGANVVINGRSNVNAGLLESFGNNACFIQADITKKVDRERLFYEAKKRFGDISILVTNADGPIAGSFMEKSIDDWKDAFELIILSAIDMAKRCVPEMIENGFGRIVNISSTSAKETVPGSVFANSLKPALIGAYNTLARELASTGITVNNILPGPFKTDRIINYAKSSYENELITSEEALEKYENTMLMKRIGNIDEIGALCAFICSKSAGYITGQSIVIDGGKVKSLL